MSKELFQEQRQYEAMQENRPAFTTLEKVMDYLIGVEENVDSGTVDPIVSLAIINKIEKAVKDVKASVYDSALIEAQNYPEKTFEHKGVWVERRNGRKVYDFKGIQEWNDLNDKRKEKEAIYKSAFDAYQKGKTMVDDETGEQIPIPAVSNNKDVLVIKS